MDGLAAYATSASSSEDEASAPSLSLPSVVSAPHVRPDALALRSLQTARLHAVDAKEWRVNLPVDATLAPYQGPHGSAAPASTTGGTRVVTGVIERAAMADASFDGQYHAFNQRHDGTARRATVLNADAAAVGDILTHNQGNQDVTNRIPVKSTARRKRAALEHEKALTEREKFGDAATDGVWAPMDERVVQSDVEAGTMTEEQRMRREERLEQRKRKAESSEIDEELAFDRLVERKTGHLLPARLRAGQEAMEARSEFVDEHEYDYQGRSWAEPPRALKPDDGEHAVFLPKKCVHKFVGHSKGVQAVEVFPKYGHLVLSGGLDRTVRIWDVYNERKCKRVYEGHTAGVRAMHFSNDGKQFLTASFDRFIQLWDTETGQSVHSFTNRRVPYCVKFYPEDNTQFVIGDSNNMIVQFDARSGEIVQEYNHHLQAVNSVTFVDDNKRFVSTSDDKKILIWEWGIPVPVKYISEPGMHAMPTVALHPSGAFFAGQSLNNQIDVYTARDKFKLCRKKIFRGHQNAGYACPLAFSPNGQYLLGGDGEGKWCVWDWKSSKLYKKVRAHDRGPCMGVAWHPLEPSQIFTCGWDGVIKLWD